MASAVPELPVLARDQAFEALYRRYVGDVYHYALALLRNPAVAEGGAIAGTGFAAKAAIALLAGAVATGVGKDTGPAEAAPQTAAEPRVATVITAGDGSK